MTSDLTELSAALHRMVDRDPVEVAALVVLGGEYLADEVAAQAGVSRVNRR